MEKIDEMIELLKNVQPMLTEFMNWKMQEAEKEKAYRQQQTESQKEFDKWLKQRQAEEAQQQADTAELQKHFYGGEAWQRERFTPSNF